MINEPLQCQVKEEEDGTEWRGSPTLASCALNHATSPQQTSAPLSIAAGDLSG